MPGKWTISDKLFRLGLINPWFSSQFRIFHYSAKRCILALAEGHLAIVIFVFVCLVLPLTYLDCFSVTFAK